MNDPKFTCTECDNEVEAEGDICDECFYSDEEDDDFDEDDGDGEFDE